MTMDESLSCCWPFPQRLRQPTVFISDSLWLHRPCKTNFLQYDKSDGNKSSIHSRIKQIEWLTFLPYTDLKLFCRKQLSLNVSRSSQLCTLETNVKIVMRQLLHFNQRLFRQLLNIFLGIFLRDQTTSINERWGRRLGSLKLWTLWKVVTCHLHLKTENTNSFSANTNDCNGKTWGEETEDTPIKY